MQNNVALCSVRNNDNDNWYTGIDLILNAAMCTCTLLLRLIC